MDYYNFDDDRQRSQERRKSRQSLALKKQRRKKLLIRRTIIVAVMVLTLVLVITLVVSLFKAIFSNDSDADTPTVVATTAETQAPKEHLTFNEPNIPDDKKTEGHYSDVNPAIYIYNNAAFESFSGTAQSAQDYADCISEFKKIVGKDTKVYNMVIPNHTEFGIPKRLIDSGKVNTKSQAENIKEIYSRYTQDVIPINCYNKLSEHVNEYIYFNTDYYWTGLGAYYAYTAFCEQTDQKILDLSVCTENTIDGFEGSLVDLDPVLRENLDSVHFWTFPYQTYGMRTEESGSQPYETTVYYEGETPGPYSYGVFIWGDCPLFVEHNSELKNSKKIAVVKESYGNAFVPYLTANYEEVHVIDYRYFDKNIALYLKENGIKEVLFLNNVIAANTDVQVDRLKEITE